MNHRFFRAAPGTPAFNRFQEVADIRQKASVRIKEFGDRIGARQVFGTSPKNYHFSFDTPPDRNVWRKVRNHYTPRKNTPGGRELVQEINTLPSCPSWDDVFQEIPGIENRFPYVIVDSMGYTPFIRYGSLKHGLLIISVPWVEYPPEKLEAYKAERAVGDHFDTGLEHALWTPPEWLTEIKEWEALKLIDEAKSADTAEAAA